VQILTVTLQLRFVQTAISWCWHSHE